MRCFAPHGFFKGRTVMTLLRIDDLKKEIKDHYRSLFRKEQEGGDLAENNHRVFAVTVAFAAVLPLAVAFPLTAPLLTFKAGAITTAVLGSVSFASKKLTEKIIASRAEKKMEREFSSGDLIDRYIHDVLEADARTSRAALIAVKRLADQFHESAAKLASSAGESLSLTSPRPAAEPRAAA